jgi:hypothetical protein
MGMPADDSWVARQFADLQRQITELRAAQTLNAATISGDGLTITDASLNVIGKLGTFANGTGVALYRPDGTLAFQVFAGFVGIFDRAGNYVVTDDTTSGQGVARPYVPFGAFADNSAPTQTTQSATFVTVQTLVGYKQHPKITAQILCRSDTAGTTGEARLIDQANNQVGPTITVASAEFAYHTLPASALLGAHLSQVSLNLQIRRTAGTGNIGARGVSAWGVESSAT